MRKALTIGMTAAALTAAVPFHARGDADREQVADAGAIFAPYYQRGPRIIHVPQPGERLDDAHGNKVRTIGRPAPRAGIDRRHEPALSDDDDDDEELAPPPRRRAAVPKRSEPAPPRKPRWTPRADAPPPPPPPPPPPTGPRRAVLSAPPPRAETPNWIRPTPRFEEKFGGEKFGDPDRPATTSVIPPPYVPPPVATQPKPNDAGEDATDPIKTEQ